MGKDRRVIEGQMNLFEFSTAANEPDKVREQAAVCLAEAGGFPGCADCWCRDCKHNEANDGVPREFGGQSLPCPACRLCVEQGEADICMIGSAEEGCSVRAHEDGVKTSHEEYTGLD